ncbi:MAG: M20/M25/M40 family metallo-hydrolase [Lachnospiraceae bacterium]|nr:M20/M25/M40 family metallo-hydrolase [Lachnospiraceae bacterium]
MGKRGLPSPSRKRLTDDFLKLASFDSESFHEKAIAEHMMGVLKELGLEIRTDRAREELLKQDPERTETASNIYAYLPGNIEGDARVFCTHMDTVAPGVSKKIVEENGILRSKGDTICGADDISGIVSILEAVRLIKEHDLKHPDIELLFAVAEEPYCLGSRFFDPSLLKAKTGYVLDLTGRVGRAAVAAPSVISFDIVVRGLAAHAGFAPEKGINALNVAARAMLRIGTGRIRENQTVNFGTVSGGSGRNIVPEEIRISGEIRSNDHELATKQAMEVEKVFKDEAENVGATAETSVTEHVRAYRIDEEGPAVKRFLRAAMEVTGEKGECVETYGGSDASRLNVLGIETAVLACAMENCHSTTEYADLAELERSAAITLALMTDPE